MIISRSDNINDINACLEDQDLKVRKQISSIDNQLKNIHDFLNKVIQDIEDYNAKIKKVKELLKARLDDIKEKYHSQGDYSQDDIIEQIKEVLDEDDIDSWIDVVKDCNVLHNYNTECAEVFIVNPSCEGDVNGVPVTGDGYTPIELNCSSSQAIYCDSCYGGEYIKGCGNSQQNCIGIVGSSVSCDNGDNSCLSNVGGTQDSCLSGYSNVGGSTICEKTYKTSDGAVCTGGYEEGDSDSYQICNGTYQTNDGTHCEGQFGWEEGGNKVCRNNYQENDVVVCSQSHNTTCQRNDTDVHTCDGQDSCDGCVSCDEGQTIYITGENPNLPSFEPEPEIGCKVGQTPIPCLLFH